jgi:hypothetical protein
MDKKSERREAENNYYSSTNLLLVPNYEIGETLPFIHCSPFILFKQMKDFKLFLIVYKNIKYNWKLIMEKIFENYNLRSKGETSGQ